MQLTPEEIARAWKIGLSLEGAHLPDDELLQALDAGRVQMAQSWSSMGTAETYWHRARIGTTVDHMRLYGAVVPPGKRAYHMEPKDYIDDRDVTDVLWRPFWADQQEQLVAALSTEQRNQYIAERERLGTGKQDLLLDNKLRFQLLRFGLALLD